MSASTERKNRQLAREQGNDKKAIAAKEEAAKKKKSDLRFALAGIGIALLIALTIFLNSNAVYSFTAFKVGDKSFSSAEANFYYSTQYQNWYNTYGSYASIFGLDASNGVSGLGQQACPMLENGTWKDYFIGYAEDQMVQVKATGDYAAQNGIALDADELAEIDSDIEMFGTYAQLYGFSNVNQFLTANFGSGVNEKVVRNGYADTALAAKVINQVSESFEYSDEQLKAAYAGFEGSRDVFDYATFTAENEAQADAVVKAYNKSKADDAYAKFEEAVDSAAASEPSRSSNVTGTYLSTSYAEWLMDSARKSGDITTIPSTAEDDESVSVLLFIGRDMNDYPVAQVRHILVKAEASEDGTYTEEAKAAAKARAEEILAEFNAGDKSEESFAALAEQYSEDGGSNTNGGLYDSITKGQTVEEFDAFCFAADRKPGDTAVVYGESGSYAGYHVMYYVGEGRLNCDILAENELRNNDTNEWLENITSQYTTSTGFGMKFVG